MGLTDFFTESFTAHDLADALMELGHTDVLEEAETKVALAKALASLSGPLEQTLDGFYPQALSNACKQYGLPIGDKRECVAQLATYLRDQRGQHQGS
jgi:hypothetical protein